MESLHLGLNLVDAQQQVWEHQLQHPVGLPQTIKEAISRLSGTVRDGEEAFEAGNLVQAQMRLEECLMAVLITMRMFNLDPEKGLERALLRSRQQATALAGNTFYFYVDRVEIRTGGELCGEWFLYNEQEYQAALQLARELGCEIIHSDVRQLELFAENVHKSLEPLGRE